jgi:hypothetical protein
VLVTKLFNVSKLMKDDLARKRYVRGCVCGCVGVWVGGWVSYYYICIFHYCICDSYYHITACVDFFFFRQGSSGARMRKELDELIFLFFIFLFF